MIGSDNFFFSSKGVRIVKKSFALQTHSVENHPKKSHFYANKFQVILGAIIWKYLHAACFARNGVKWN